MAIGLALRIVLGFFAFGITVIISALWFWSKSFIYEVWIAKQTGKEISDVIWFKDKCKVREKKGRYTILFRRQKSRSQSFPGSFWSKFMKNQKEVIWKEDWDTEGWSRNLKRGLFLYQTSEGEFYPMRPSDDGGKLHFKILDQDNRAFIMDSYEHANEMTLTTRQQIIAIVGVVIGLVILGVAFVLFLVYMTEAAATLCGSAGGTVLETASNVVGG